MWVSMHPRRVPTKALQTLLLRLGRQCQTARFSFLVAALLLQFIQS